MAAIVKAAATQIGSLLSQEAQNLYAVRDKFEYLQGELEMMHAFLHDVDTKNHQKQDSEVILKAISRIRDLAYEAEDIVDKYWNGVTNKRELDGILNTLKWGFNGLLCNPCDAAIQHQVGTDIDALTRKLSELTSQLQRYKVEGSRSQVRSNGASSSMVDQQQRRKAFLHMLEEDPIGLDKATETSVNVLVCKETKVISIYGMGGLGKSTLAKSVFNKKVVRDHFDLFAWVFVSQDFQAIQVWRAILLKLYPKNEDKRKQINKLSDIELPETLNQELQDNKCLVVLDDLWTDGDWRSLLPAFWSINQGSNSKLLITTRNQKLLEHVDPKGFPYELQCLDEKQSWELFQRKITPMLGETKLEGDIESLAMKMVNKCKGLPLAILSIIGILAKKKTREEWEDVYLRLRNIRQDKDGIILQVLELSYYDLPHYLRPCFLNLAFFPEDYEISVEKLQHLWEAEGLLELQRTIHRVTVKDVTRSYLIDLAERFLIVVGKTTRSGKIKKIHLHDMIRDMCISKAREDNFLHVITKGELNVDGVSFGSSSDMRTEKLYRLSMHHIGEGTTVVSLCNLFQRWSHLRSLMIFITSRMTPLLGSYFVKATGKSFISLRVLDLEGAKLDKGRLPSEIGDLVYLRYMSLKGIWIRELPSSIGNLRCLLTLDLRIKTNNILSGHVVVPNVLSKLKRLRHLYLPKYFRCKGGALLKLSSLTRLETLINFDTAECRIKDLYELINLKKFEFSKNANILNSWKAVQFFLPCPTTLSNAFKKPLILRVDASLFNREQSSFQQLWMTSVQDPSMYQLTIQSKMSTVAILESALPSTVLYLTLCHSELERDPTPILESKLPQLKCLCLYGCLNRDVKEMVCSKGGFPQLTTLVLCHLYIEELKVEDGSAMPSLIRFCTYDCNKLRTNVIMAGGRRVKSSTSARDVEFYVTTVGKGFRRWVTE